MKRVANLLIIYLLTCVSASAVTRPETDQYLVFVNNHADRTAEITGYNASWAGTPIPSNFVLPSFHIPSYPETRYEVIGFYGNEVFRGCSNITSIAIPRTYKLIPTKTFIDCENLYKFSWATGDSEGKSGDYFIEGGVFYSLYSHFGSSYGIWKMFCYPAGKPESEFQVPDKCNSIGEYCFYKQRHLERVIFHNKLKVIGKYSFYGCQKLESVVIPGSVSEIGASAFEKCSSLESVTIPASVSQIGERAFAECVNLKRIIIDDGVVSIGSEAFADCTSLETIIIPSTVTHIDERAFAGCSNLKTFILQAGIKTFGTDVFFDCHSLNEVRIVDLSGWCQSDFATPLANPAYLSKKINHIGEIITDLTIPANTEHIGQNAFYGYTPLKSVSMNNNISLVSKDAFAECNNIKEINISDLSLWCNIDFESEKSNPLTYARSLTLGGTQIDILNIPEGIKKIKQYAFINGNFTEIRIPSSVNEISNAAFKGMSPISVRCGVATPPSIANTAFTDYSATLFVPMEGKALYWVHSVWGLFSDIKDIPVEADSISLDKSEVEMNVNDRLSLSVAFNPLGTTDKNIIWSSSDESIAIVENGMVTALKKGNATITATTKNNKSASCRLTVKDILANNITISPVELLLSPGSSAKLEITLLPENTTNKSLNWYSDNEEVATISQDGIVKALSGGSAQIIVTTLDGSNISARCNIIVSELKVSSILLNPSYAEGDEGEQIQLNATILPEDATNKTVTWSSSNESIATVDDSGLVSLLMKGSVIITASATDGSAVSAECVVVVKEYLAIKDILTDKNTFVKIFNLNGILVYEGIFSEANIVPGYYIVEYCGESLKIKVY